MTPLEGIAQSLSLWYCIGIHTTRKEVLHHVGSGNESP